MKKRSNNKTILHCRTIPGLLTIAFLLLLFSGGYYARKDRDRLTDRLVSLDLSRHFLLGETFAVAGEIPFPTPTLTQEQEIEQEIERVFGQKADLFKKIAFCESGFRPSVVSKTGDVGLFQINLAAHQIPTRFLQDWRVNIAVARFLYETSDLSPWRASSGCWRDR